MNYSFSPILLYGLILFTAIAEGMKNEKSGQISPNMIQITGRIGLNSGINGYYFKGNGLYNERVYYYNQNKFSYLLWNQKLQYWSIDHVLDNNRYIAKLEEDVLFPTLATKYWIFYDGVGKGCNVDENVVIEKIDEKDVEKDLCFNTFKDVRILTLTLEPGLLGLNLNWKTGDGITINDKCQKLLKQQLGTGEDWKIVYIDGKSYNESLLDKKIAGDTPYKLIFINRNNYY